MYRPRGREGRAPRLAAPQSRPQPGPPAPRSLAFAVVFIVKLKVTTQ